MHSHVFLWHCKWNQSNSRLLLANFLEKARLSMNMRGCFPIEAMLLRSSRPCKRSEKARKVLTTSSTLRQRRRKYVNDISIRFLQQRVQGWSEYMASEAAKVWKLEIEAYCITYMLTSLSSQIYSKRIDNTNRMKKVSVWTTYSKSLILYKNIYN